MGQINNKNIEICWVVPEKLSEVKSDIGTVGFYSQADALRYFFSKRSGII